MIMLKKTSRYKLNKMISETPVDDIQFVLDVSRQNLHQVVSEMKRILDTESMTVIVISNKSQRGIL